MARVGRPRSMTGGINLIRRAGTRIMRGILRDIARLEAIADESGKKEDIIAVLDRKLELIPFILPKLQAIAPAQMDDEGMLASDVRAFVRKVKEELNDLSNQIELSRETDDNNGSKRVDSILGLPDPDSHGGGANSTISGEYPDGITSDNGG